MSRPLRRDRGAHPTTSTLERFALPRTWADWVLLVFSLWFGTSAYLYLFDRGGPKPLYAYAALICLTVLVMLAQMTRGGIRLPTIDGRLLGLVTWALVFLAAAAFSFALAGRAFAASDPYDPLVKAVEFVLLTAAFFFLASNRHSLQVMLTGLVIVALSASAINVFDFFTHAFTSVSGRAAGLYGNPNIAGNIIVLAMACTTLALPKRWRLVYVLACGAGVLLTFSREAWLCWAIAVTFAIYQGQFGGLRYRRLLVIPGIVIGGGVILLLFSGALGALLVETGFSQHLNADTMERLGISDNALAGESSDERRKLAQLALRHAAEAPILGKGIGYATAWGDLRPHNMFLLTVVEQGLVGVALFGAFLILLWINSSGPGRIAALLFIVISQFSHNQFEQPEMMMIIAFIIAHGALSRAAVRRRTYFPRTAASNGSLTAASSTGRYPGPQGAFRGV